MNTSPSLEDEMHPSIILHLSYVAVGPFKLIVTADSHRAIHIYNENNIEDFECVRKILNVLSEKDEINCMEINVYLSQIAIGSTCGQIWVFDFETGKLEGICTPPKRVGQPDITHVSFLDPYPILLAVNQSNEILCYGVKPSLQSRFLLFARIKHTCCITAFSTFRYVNEQRKASPLSLFFIEKLNDLDLRGLIGDENGDVHSINLNEWVQLTDEDKASSIPETLLSYNPLRKYTQDCEGLQESYSLNEQQNTKRVTISKMSNLITASAEGAHRQLVSSVQFMKELRSYISACVDGSFKIWTIGLELLCYYNVHTAILNKPSGLWDFPYNWEEKTD